MRGGGERVVPYKVLIEINPHTPHTPHTPLGSPCMVQGSTTSIVMSSMGVSPLPTSTQGESPLPTSTQGESPLQTNPTGVSTEVVLQPTPSTTDVSPAPTTAPTSSTAAGTEPEPTVPTGGETTAKPIAVALSAQATYGIFAALGAVIVLLLLVSLLTCLVRRRDKKPTDNG